MLIKQHRDVNFQKMALSLHEMNHKNNHQKE